MFLSDQNFFHLFSILSFISFSLLSSKDKIWPKWVTSFFHFISFPRFLQLLHFYLIKFLFFSRFICNPASLQYLVSLFPISSSSSILFEITITSLVKWRLFRISSLIFSPLLAIFRNKITAILTSSTSEEGEWGRWGWSRFSFWRSLITNPQC